MLVTQVLSLTAPVTMRVTPLVLLLTVLKNGGASTLDQELPREQTSSAGGAGGGERPAGEGEHARAHF